MTSPRKPTGPYGQLFWARLNRFSPLLCRLLARVPRGRPLESTEIAERSGLSVSQVDAISQQTDWRGIDLPTAHQFMLACDTDLSNRQHCRRMRMFLKSQPKHREGRFQHLKRSPNWKVTFLPLLVRLENHVKAKK
jgi:hypothetical protein